MKDSIQLSQIQAQIQNLDLQINDMHTLVSHSHDVIANEIAASDRTMSVTGIILGIIAIVVGVYITWCTKKMQNLKMSVEQKEQDVIRLKKVVDETNHQIQNDIEGLYDRLKMEETKSILNRLNNVPDDIVNVASILAIRKLDKKDYELLRRAFVKLGPESEFRVCYLLEFFQHFAGIAIVDPILRNGLIANFDILVEKSFENDILKSTTEMMAELCKMEDGIKMQVLLSYYKAIKNSKYKDFKTLYLKMMDVVSNEQWQSIVYDSTEESDEID